ncbi:hypothetical protein DRN72_01125 [Methanosarcinales archaeon]|nr:MAG: hypothetical protein DRN72_01125 [Methanosarcinales archaeon]
MYDVVVVGASPAGIACTLRCSELGLSTALFDRKPSPSFHPACTFFEGMANQVGFRVDPSYV